MQIALYLAYAGIFYGTASLYVALFFGCLSLREQDENAPTYGGFPR